MSATPVPSRSSESSMLDSLVSRSRRAVRGAVMSRILSSGVSALSGAGGGGEVGGRGGAGGGVVARGRSELAHGVEEGRGLRRGARAHAQVTGDAEVADDDAPG